MMLSRNISQGYRSLFLLAAMLLAWCAVSKTAFGQYSPDKTEFSMTLAPGWNFIAAPFAKTGAVSGVSFSQGCGENGKLITSIYHYVPSTGAYENVLKKYNYQTIADALKGFEPGIGYWVYFEGGQGTECTITFSGSGEIKISDIGESDTSGKKGRLSQGWNQISGTTQALQLKAYLSSEALKQQLGGSACVVESIYGYDTKVGAYFEIEKKGLEDKEPNKIEVGKAYWVYADVEKPCSLSGATDILSASSENLKKLDLEYVSESETDALILDFDPVARTKQPLVYAIVSNPSSLSSKEAAQLEELKKQYSDVKIVSAGSIRQTHTDSITGNAVSIGAISRSENSKFIGNRITGRAADATTNVDLAKTDSRVEILTESYSEDLVSLYESRYSSGNRIGLGAGSEKLAQQLKAGTKQIPAIYRKITIPYTSFNELGDIVNLNLQAAVRDKKGDIYLMLAYDISSKYADQAYFDAHKTYAVFASRDDGRNWELVAKIDAAEKMAPLGFNLPTRTGYYKYPKQKTTEFSEILVKECLEKESKKKKEYEAQKASCEEWRAQTNNPSVCQLPIPLPEKDCQKAGVITVYVQESDYPGFNLHPALVVAPEEGVYLFYVIKGHKIRTKSASSTYNELVFAKRELHRMKISLDKGIRDELLSNKVNKAESFVYNSIYYNILGLEFLTVLGESQYFYDYYSVNGVATPSIMVSKDYGTTIKAVCDGNLCLKGEVYGNLIGLDKNNNLMVTTTINTIYKQAGAKFEKFLDLDVKPQSQLVAPAQAVRDKSGNLHVLQVENSNSAETSIFYYFVPAVLLNNKAGTEEKLYDSVELVVGENCQSCQEIEAFLVKNKVSFLQRKESNLLEPLLVIKKGETTTTVSGLDKIGMANYLGLKLGPWKINSYNRPGSVVTYTYCDPENWRPGSTDCKKKITTNYFVPKIDLTTLYLYEGLPAILIITNKGLEKWYYRDGVWDKSELFTPNCASAKCYVQFIGPAVEDDRGIELIVNTNSKETKTPIGTGTARVYGALKDYELFSARIQDDFAADSSPGPKFPGAILYLPLPEDALAGTPSLIGEMNKFSSIIVSEDGGDLYYVITVDLRQLGVHIKDGVLISGQKRVGFFEGEAVSGKLKMPVYLYVDDEEIGESFVNFVVDNNNAVILNNYDLTYIDTCSAKQLKADSANTISPEEFKANPKITSCLGRFKNPLSQFVVTDCDSLKLVEGEAEAYFDEILDDLATRPYQNVYGTNKRKWLFAAPYYAKIGELGQCDSKLAAAFSNVEYGQIKVFKLIGDVAVKEGEKRTFTFE